MELDATWGRATKIWWSYLWRNLIAILAAIVASGVLGFIIGFIMAIIGAENSTIQFVTAPIGAIVAVLISIIPMKMILNKDFGEFRLALVPKVQNTSMGADQ